MKIRSIALLSIAAAAITPTFAQANDAEVLQKCMDVFAAQNFPGTAVMLTADTSNRSPMLPLIAQTGTQSVQLVATAKSDGRVLARSTCQVRDIGAREGEVTITPIE